MHDDEANDLSDAYRAKTAKEEMDREESRQHVQRLRAERLKLQALAEQRRLNPEPPRRRLM